MRIWGADGALQLDENSFTMRVTLSLLVGNTGWVQSGPRAGMGYQEFAVDGTPGNSVAVVLPAAAYNADTTTQFETEMLNGAVRVYNYNRGFPSGTWASTATSMRLMVVRFA
jgi:hypothetical protein